MLFQGLYGLLSLIAVLIIPATMILDDRVSDKYLPACMQGHGKAAKPREEGKRPDDPHTVAESQSLVNEDPKKKEEGSGLCSDEPLGSMAKEAPPVVAGRGVAVEMQSLEWRPPPAAAAKAVQQV